MVFRHISLNSKFTQKYFLYYGGIYHLIAYKIHYLTVHVVFFKKSLAICHIKQGHF